MNRINLLPREEKSACGRSEHIFTIAIFFFLLSLGSVWGYLTYVRHQLAEQLHEIHQQQELLKPTREQMQTANAKQQAISARQKILMTITQERPPLYAALARLGAIIPDGIWLTDVASDRNLLKVIGMAQDYPKIAAFMNKIQDEPSFTEFMLVRTEQEKATTKFEFTVKYKGM